MAALAVFLKLIEETLCAFAGERADAVALTGLDGNADGHAPGGELLGLGLHGGAPLRVQLSDIHVQTERGKRARLFRRWLELVRSPMLSLLGLLIAWRYFDVVFFPVFFLALRLL